MHQVFEVSSTCPMLFSPLPLLVWNDVGRAGGGTAYEKNYLAVSSNLCGLREERGRGPEQRLVESALLAGFGG